MIGSNSEVHPRTVGESNCKINTRCPEQRYAKPSRDQVELTTSPVMFNTYQKQEDVCQKGPAKAAEKSGVQEAPRAEPGADLPGVNGPVPFLGAQEDHPTAQ